MKIVCVIQARIKSTRLPGKVLMDLNNRPVIQAVLDRVKQAKLIDQIYLATTADVSNEVLIKWAEQNQLEYYKGSETDVLESFYQIARFSKADVLVRITADCPLIDPVVIDEVIKLYQTGDCDYACNTQPPTFPDGLDVEVFSANAITKAHNEAKLASEHEHATPYIWKNPALFKIKTLHHEPDLSAWRFTLDTAEDFELIKLIDQACQKQTGVCDLSKIVQIINQNPDWLKLNASHSRNEGYQKSLNAEKN